MWLSVCITHFYPHTHPFFSRSSCNKPSDRVAFRVYNPLLPTHPLLWLSVCITRFYPHTHPFFSRSSCNKPSDRVMCRISYLRKHAPDIIIVVAVWKRDNYLFLMPRASTDLQTRQLFIGARVEETKPFKQSRVVADVKRNLSCHTYQKKSFSAHWSVHTVDETVSSASHD